MSASLRGAASGGPGPETKEVRWQVHAGLVAGACALALAYELRGHHLSGWDRVGHGALALFAWLCIGVFVVTTGYLRYQRRAVVHRLVASAVAAPFLVVMLVNVYLVVSGAWQGLLSGLPPPATPP